MWPFFLFSDAKIHHLVENFAWGVLLYIRVCGKLSTTTKEKSPRRIGGFRISDIRKSAGNTICGT